MRAVIQRCEKAQVFAEVDGCFIDRGFIGKGLVVLIGVEESDNEKDVEYLFRKIRDMRIFNDEFSKMNLSLSDIGGQVAVISQFTLHAVTKKGNRPSFIKAANPNIAANLYELFRNKMESSFPQSVISGVFGAMMKIDFVNDGPVTIILDSKNKDF